MSNKDNSISKAVVSRLPRYYRYLGELMESGTERISSGELSKRMNVTASQIRQDLNNFGGFGQQGYGYNVKYLYFEIAKILGVDKKHNMIIIGAGNLGRALANYANFSKSGFVVTGLFDNNETIIGKEVRGVKIQPMDKLKEFIIKNDVDIATLTIPKKEAKKVAETLAECGIKGIWNFAHTDLDLPDNIVVENVHLSESLMELSYNIAHTDTKSQS
ncbi:MAG: redox-sensing transcriptional repressor Rex [Lachnospiraceae bacterium]|nr:redox-sensing transcriptional repressor Rex [Lachnospiraceae bacterium]